MSGWQYLNELGEITPEDWIDIAINTRNRAGLAGHSHATARMVHEQALRLSKNGLTTYEDAESAILHYLATNDDSRVNLNAALDKYSQPMRPGPNMDQTGHDVYKIMKHNRVNKSSKGKHPSNRTPPKKKRK